MTHHDIKKLAARRPFRPFSIHLTDGQVLDVRREEEIGLHPHTKKTVVVFEPDGGYWIIDIGQIATLQVA
jgi:hypothetical protein